MDNTISNVHTLKIHGTGFDALEDARHAARLCSMYGDRYYHVRTSKYRALPGSRNNQQVGDLCYHVASMVHFSEIIFDNTNGTFINGEEIIRRADGVIDGVID